MERRLREANVKGSGGAGSKQHELHLVAQARVGDKKAIRDLVDLHKDRLFSFIWRMIRHHHDAEEVCQEAFLKAFASLNSYSGEYRFSTWLFTIGYRVCLNRLRRRKAMTSELDLAALPLEAKSNPAETLESEEASHLKSRVWNAVDQLSAPQRATILLFYRQEMGCHEIARVLELPIATVKSHLHRARLRLRELLETVQEKDLQLFRNRAG